MSWFDEQIKERKREDMTGVMNSLMKIASAITGGGALRASDDRRIQAEGAIAEILRYYHVKGRDLPENITSPEDVIDYELRPHGIMSRGVRLTKGWSKRSAGPMLAKLSDGDEVIALIPRLISGYRYFDPRSGAWVNVTRRGEKLISQDGLVFYKPFPKDKKGLYSLLYYIAENVDKSDIIAYLLFTAIITAIGMATVDLTEMLVSNVARTGNLLIAQIPQLSELVFIAVSVYMLSLIIGKVLYGTYNDLILQRILHKLEMDVSAASMMRLLSLPPNFFNNYSSGELATRLENINDLMDMVVSSVLTMGVTSAFSLVYIKQISEFAAPLVVPALLTTAATLVVTILTVFINMRISRERLEIDARENGMTYALVSGVRKIKTTGAERRAFSRWAELYSKSARLEFDPPLFIKANASITMGIGLIGTLVMFYMAAANGVSQSGYFAFITAYGMVSGAFSSLSGIAINIANIKPVLEMARPILDARCEVDEDRTAVEKLSGAVELSGVTFSYSENGPKVLDDLSVKIKAGSYVAIVGETGCGKSTLMKMLLGFEKPQRGSVYYDGRDLETLDVRSVRQRIGVVMQEGKLFSGDIFSNITISAPLSTLDDAWEAAEMAGMADDIRDMPMGMNTIISEGGGGISGGQKQRLMIARAIAGKPNILMFDEATSALDNITQKKVSQSLDGLNCTRIVIAHRLSTIKNCDRILVLNSGRIIEDGSYEELMARDGFFADLVKRQIA